MIGVDKVTGHSYLGSLKTVSMIAKSSEAQLNRMLGDELMRVTDDHVRYKLISRENGALFYEVTAVSKTYDKRRFLRDWKKHSHVSGAIDRPGRLTVIFILKDSRVHAATKIQQAFVNQRKRKAASKIVGAMREWSCFRKTKANGRCNTSHSRSLRPTSSLLLRCFANGALKLRGRFSISG